MIAHFHMCMHAMQTCSAAAHVVEVMIRAYIASLNVLLEAEYDDSCVYTWI